MERSRFQASSWYQAIPLSDRIPSLLAQGKGFEFDVQLAQKRIHRWRTQPPFETSSFLTERLTMDGLIEEKFLYLLGESTETLQNRLIAPPSWLKDLEQAFSSSNFNEAILPSDLPPDQESLGFLYTIDPLICQSLDRLHQGVEALFQRYSDLPFDPNTIEDVLFDNLPEQLLRILNRTMVLELNVARLQGFLKGNSSKERFWSFLERLCQQDVTLALLQEYPVLARQTTLCLEQWVKFSLEFLQHLCADWELIRSTFSPDQDLGVLVQVDAGAGDRHQGGRTVLIATFNSGFRIVYKPRALTVDVHFQELLTRLNERGNHPPFATLKILDRFTYGWVEFIAQKSCTCAEEVQQFYERQGGYLALLYALEATDFHFENLIAAGTYPVLIDLETLFSDPSFEGGLEQSNLPTSGTSVYSVLQTGLLPQRIWSNNESEGIDLSGLAASSGQLTPHRSASWEGVGTDEMKFTPQQVEMPEGQNRPTLNGTEVNVLDHTEAINTGFTNIYRLLLEYRDELIADNGLLSRFADDEVRVVLRPTRTYSLLLRESFHPDVLRNALERDRLFDHLWIAVQYNPRLKNVIAAEREDLWNGDIPRFTTRPNSRDLWTSNNKQIANFFDEPGMARIQRRLQHLSEDDLAQQLWFIRASLTTLVMNTHQGQGSRYSLTQYSSSKTDLSPQQDSLEEERSNLSLIDQQYQLLAAAQKIGDRLEALVLRGKQDVNWMGLTLTKGRHWSLAPLSTNLYDGIPGIALFLAYLGEVTQQERYTDLAQSALTTVRRQVERNQSFITWIGGFCGWGGIIYTLTHLGTLWNQPELIAEAEGFVDLIFALIEKDEQLDIIGGAAGCIGSLLSLYRCKPSQHTLDVAIQCGEHLIAFAQPMERGRGWVLKNAGNKALAGFSHGAAGIAWALLELAALTGAERFRNVALDAIAYERSLFSLEADNWLDLREVEPSVRRNGNAQVTCMTAWCHGAPGIGLARLQTLPHFNDAQIRGEIDTALNTTLNQGFGFNHSLCHGDLGNLELLLQASLTFDDPTLFAQVNRLAAIILESINQHGWLCGVPLGVETPGLMTGLAGIGYGLLRLAQPTRIPSVLVLEAPKPLPSQE